MLKIILAIAAVAIVVVAAVVLYASTRPDTFSVARSAVIAAPPQKIYPLIADFRRWRDWSPFEKLDPELKRSFSGAEAGLGAVYGWDGNGKAGAGRMEIVEARDPNKILIKLDFSKPFEANNLAEFTLEPAGDATRVTWEMRGPTPLVAKVMHLFMSMDGMVGGAFEEGLAEMKAIAER